MNTLQYYLIKRRPIISEKATKRRPKIYEKVTKRPYITKNATNITK